MMIEVFTAKIKAEVSESPHRCTVDLLLLGNIHGAN